MGVITNRGYILKKEEISNEMVEKIRRDLFVRPEGETFIPKYKVYRETKNCYVLPRYYGIETFGDAENRISEGISIKETKFVGELRNSTNQPEAVEKTLDHLKKHNGGILSLPTGYGKTTVALYILSQLSIRTIIFVHKEFLMNQWIEKIKEFLPEMSIGKIQGKVIDVLGKDIVIAMLQSICIKEYPLGTFEGFGLMIIDETHHICTRVFSKVFFKISTKYFLGLSATVERKDGLTKVIEWFIGKIAYKIYRKNQYHVQVQKINYKCEEYKKEFPLNKTGKLCIVDAISVLIHLQNRNNLIADLIIENKERSIIVLSDRREHCFILKELLESKKDFDKTIGLYIGGIKPLVLKQNEKCDIIIGTYSLAHEGLDIPKLDTLIMATPKVDIVQSVGRILRETQGKKNNPVVIDIIDNWGCFKYQFCKRKKFYKDVGFFITNDEENKNKTLGYMFVSE